MKVRVSLECTAAIMVDMIVEAESEEAAEQAIQAKLDDGAYVMGWRWVSFAETPFDKDREEEEEETAPEVGHA